MEEYEKLFRFAAKAGALEGYLYNRQNVEPLHNWIDNIEKIYMSLAPQIKDDIREEFCAILRKILDYGEKSIEAELRAKLSCLLLEIQK